MQVVKITQAQKDALSGQQFAPDSYFNPILDEDGDWIISVEETNQAKEIFSWIKDLPKKEHKPKVKEFKKSAMAKVGDFIKSIFK